MTFFSIEGIKLRAGGCLGFNDNLESLNGEQTKLNIQLDET